MELLAAWSIPIISFIAAGLGSLLGSYLKEKGKNQAKIEDTEHITYLTERAKNLATTQDIEKITKKIESIKTELGFANQQRTAIKENERQALSAFVSDCLMAIHQHLNYDVTLIGYKDAHLIAEHEKSVHQIFAKIRMDFNTLRMYFPKDSTLLQKAEAVVEASISTHKYFSKEFPNFSLRLVSALEYLKRQQEPADGTTPPPAESVSRMEEGATRAAQDYREKLIPLTRQFDKAVDELVDEVQQYFQNLGMTVSVSTSTSAAPTSASSVSSESKDAAATPVSEPSSVEPILNIDVGKVEEDVPTEDSSTQSGTTYGNRTELPQ